MAAFLSILIARLERIVDKNRALRSADAAAVDPSGVIAASFSRRMALLSRAVYFAVLSALATAALLIGAFVAALSGVGHARFIALMFAVSLALLMASLVELTPKSASIWRTCISSDRRPSPGLSRFAAVVWEFRLRAGYARKLR